MRYLVFPLLVFFLPLCWSEENVTDNKCKNNYGAKVDSLQGKVFFDPDSKGNWRQAKLHDVLCEGSRVRVELYSRASLSLSNGVVLRLDEGTVLSLNGIAPDQNTLLELLTGFIHFISRTPRHLEVTSPIANAGPEGTEFAMSVNETKASLWVYEGGVRFFNPQGSVRLKPGQGAHALAGQAPKAQIDIRPQDAVNWALYYPPLLPYPEASAMIDAGIRTAIRDFRQGRVDDALFRLDALAPEKRTPYFYKVRGAIRLTAGRVDLAKQDIRAILANKPNDAEALALQSVLALTQNRKEEALQLANNALSSDPASPTAYSALSYAEQGRFELDKALAAADQATKFAPHDAMVWARKAELELSQGLTSKSKEAAQKASELDATLERTQTVMGFSYLLRMEADDAKEAFERAVQLDSTSPLARLGLGLAKIRNGDLEEGRRDLEIAAILDPNNSIVRSYLGKAYYEEKRSPLAQDQFDLAKQRDPKDPTPFFYDAINKQTTNRPVEALHDMQKAIDLNDNRAVYRSSLSLDKDLAARSAAQGRIYTDLGFQRLGLLEGWKSTNTDPTNYSAHRLLADSYASQPQHEIARISELLQSQLLQPINITPIQPQLAQSNIFIVDGLGPSSLSFNEFNPMFTRNRFALQASGIYGSNNTWGEDVVHSGLWDKVSYSLGQFHYETDGFRENNFLKQDIYNAFVQGDITSSLNLQAEYRHEDRNNGDLTVNFNSENFSPNFIENRYIDSYRIGGLYHFSPESLLIGSLIYQDYEISQNREIPIAIPQLNINFIADSLIKRKGFINELQHQYTGKKFTVTSGFGHIDQAVHQVDIAGLALAPEIHLYNPDIDRTNVYSYLHLKYINNLDATLGISYDHLKIDGLFERNPVNPKLGLVLNNNSGTTLRAAFFRTMNITRTSNQTIEPTQVSGFNQLFDDINGTIAWRYGGALDQKISSNIFAGLEYSERKLDVPISLTSVNWKEKLGRAYFYITPNNFLSLTTEYFYEKIDRHENTVNTGIVNVETHRVPVTVRLFHPSGISAMLKGSYINQYGIFEKVDTFEGPFHGSSHFFIFDLDFNYRFPSRFGIMSFGIKNIFDNRVNYQSNNSFIGSNSNEIPFAPERILFSRFNLAF